MQTMTNTFLQKNTYKKNIKYYKICNKNKLKLNRLLGNFSFNFAETELCSPNMVLQPSDAKPKLNHTYYRFYLQICLRQEKIIILSEPIKILTTFCKDGKNKCFKNFKTNVIFGEEKFTNKTIYTKIFK